MTPTRRPHGSERDRGTTLVEVVVGLFLVAMAAGVLAQLMMSTARSAPDDTVAADVALALDAFSRDVREADYVDVVTTRGRITSVTANSGADSIDWNLEGESLVRDDGSTARAMAAGLDSASTFTLRGPDGDPVAANDDDAVRWCTRLVELSLVGEDWTASRGVALRVETAGGVCP